MAIKDLKELNLLRSRATDILKNFPMGQRLPGMSRDLSLDEAVVMAYHDAVLEFLNRHGAIKEGWLEQNRHPLVIADSNPDTDDYE